MPSSVWDSFSKHGPQEAKCNICAVILGYKGGSTSNMRRHLQGVHKMWGTASTSTFGSISTFATNRKCSQSRANGITKLIATMIGTDSLPFKLVENRGFRDLMNYIEPGYTVPCRKTITAAIANIYNNEKEKLLEEIRATPNVSLTTDCWTSCTMEGYMTVTCHYLKDDKLVSRILDTSPVQRLPELPEDGNPPPDGPQRHTADALANHLSVVATEWQVSEKVRAVVHDNASNTRHISDNSDLENSCDVPCAAHTLQLSINKGMAIAKVASLVGAGNRLVAHFKRSTVATKALEAKQAGMNLVKNRLITSCPTRWNSVFYMFQRLIKNRWAICAVLSDRAYTKRQDAQTLELKDENWSLMEGLVKCLRPFEVSFSL